MPEWWQPGVVGVCIPVKLLLTGKDTLNGIQRGQKDNNLKGAHTRFCRNDLTFREFRATTT